MFLYAYLLFSYASSLAGLLMVLAGRRPRSNAPRPRR